MKQRKESGGLPTERYKFQFEVDGPTGKVYDRIIVEVTNKIHQAERKIPALSNRDVFTALLSVLTEDEKFSQATVDRLFNQLTT